MSDLSEFGDKVKADKLASNASFSLARDLYADTTSVINKQFKIKQKLNNLFLNFKTEITTLTCQAFFLNNIKKKMLFLY